MEKQSSILTGGAAAISDFTSKLTRSTVYKFSKFTRVCIMCNVFLYSNRVLCLQVF